MTTSLRDSLYTRIDGARESNRNFKTLKFNEMNGGVITKEEYETVIKENQEYTDNLIERIMIDLSTLN